ncbi:B3 domain-containing protein Os07g0679700-like [Impatiens glandulifera]|uniref:B3 domain-containing protein Os07g0679700-like n=1 Tax=Impatiens glandulifera TaxID=253017 RepID=UPI001FB07D22|nr:B3 domain-containing protein Os07g0679700-like [Impatiens glandulifera]
MASKTCTNGLCGTTSSPEWKKGWPLRSGEFSNLCDKCGSSYEQLIFCETFHSNDSGWRECSFCGKRLHCGCIASSSLLELMDGGGVICIGCTKDTRHHSFPNGEEPKVGISLKELLPYCNKDTRDDGQVKEEVLLPPTSMSLSVGSSRIAKVNFGIKEIYESLAHTSLTIALASPSTNPNPNPNPSSFHGLVEERVAEKTSSSLQQVPKSRHIFPRLPKSILSAELEANAGMAQPIRVARPPAEGRVKNQLLPRYWPRITDQELQEISGDSNSTIVPLFEKVLSASDAGRIGRLVLPKACAEAYFPPISQPEGLPLRIQDVKGKEWVFQFRFWPNNNSRMYVLEGVTPCIQSMQLQAGDTVTFSRMDPDGKLLMGFRRASNSTALQTTKESSDPHINTYPKQLNSGAGDFSWLVMEKHGTDIREGLMSSLMHVPERKRSRNLGPKSKRLLIDSIDALELKLTWEEAQDILQPPNSLKPTVVTIDDNEFEEYDEPPVFGKTSIFTASMSGEQCQWTQCDVCSKWRRVSADILLPPKWTCLENVWDQSRSSCSAPDELGPKELEILLRQYKEFKKRRIAISHRLMQEQGSPGDPSAVIGDESSEPGTTLVATTTKHPRHRPGCSCIVCIQPPSGKGKHKPTCTCNVCMTVKRRFNTLMMRKKKRQSDREAEIAQRNQYDPEIESRQLNLPPPNREDQSEAAAAAAAGESSGKGRLDLNSKPERDRQVVSMRSLLEAANQPLENYLRQNGLSSLVSDQQQQQQPSSGSSRSVQEAMGDDECVVGSTVAIGEEQESVDNDDLDRARSDPNWCNLP